MKIIHFLYDLSLYAILCCYLTSCAKPLIKSAASDNPQAAIVGNVLVKSAVWQGEILLKHDVYIPKGCTLRIEASSCLNFSGEERSRLLTPFLGRKLQIMVAGKLEITGTKEAPVFLSGNQQDKPWQGIVVMPGGEVNIKHAGLENVVAGLTCFEGKYSLSDVRITNFVYGIYEWRSQGVVNRLLLEQGTFGLYNDNDVKKPPQCVEVTYPVTKYKPYPLATTQPDKNTDDTLPARWKTKFLGKVDINRDQTWEGDIFINNQVRVARGATLTIKLGSRIFFGYFDSNGDGWGEAEILVSGRIIAVGSADAKITFKALDSKQGWAGISIVDSEMEDNLFEYVQISDAVRGIHAHFSKVVVKRSRFYSNLSDLEFQDSEFQVADSLFLDSLYTVRCRESKLDFTNNRLQGGLNGIEAYKSQVHVNACDIENKSNFALKGRKSNLGILNSNFQKNRKAIMMFNSQGEVRDNMISEQVESGVYINESSVLFENNLIEKNSFDGFALRSAQVKMFDNRIFNNGHDGISLKQTQLEKSGNSFENNANQDINHQDESSENTRHNIGRY